MTSAYVFDRTAGLVHIRLAAAPEKCIADVRADAYDIVWTEAYRTGWNAAIAAVHQMLEGKKAAIEAVGRGAGQ